MSNINSVYAIGDDALQNQFGVVIPAFAPVTGLDAEGLNFRITNISIPERTFETYTVPWKTQQFTKPAGKITTPNETTMTFRADRNWAAYRVFDRWINRILDYNTGNLQADLNGVNGFRIDVSVFPLDFDGEPLNDGWTFQGAYPSNLAAISFDMESGEPITIDVTLQFIRMITNFDALFETIASGV